MFLDKILFCLSSPQLKKMSESSCSEYVLRISAAERSASGFILMSRGSVPWWLKPLLELSSWKEEKPKSSRILSNLGVGEKAVSKSEKLQRVILTSFPSRSVEKEIASGSWSMANSCDGESTASRNDAEWPPKPSVPSSTLSVG